MTPVSWNARIEPGQTDTSAGFCANRPAGSSARPVVATATGTVLGYEEDLASEPGITCSVTAGHRGRDRSGFAGLLLGAAALLVRRQRRRAA